MDVTTKTSMTQASSFSHLRGTWSSSKTEIEDVVESCPNGKSLGLDGLSYEIYKTPWDLIGD